MIISPSSPTICTFLLLLQFLSPLSVRLLPPSSPFPPYCSVPLLRVPSSLVTQTHSASLKSMKTVAELEEEIRGKIDRLNNYIGGLSAKLTLRELELLRARAVKIQTVRVHLQ